MSTRDAFRLCSSRTACLLAEDLGINYFQRTSFFSFAASPFNTSTSKVGRPYVSSFDDVHSESFSRSRELISSQPRHLSDVCSLRCASNLAHAATRDAEVRAHLFSYCELVATFGVAQRILHSWQRSAKQATIQSFVAMI